MSYYPLVDKLFSLSFSMLILPPTVQTLYEILGRLAELLVKDGIERIKATEKNDPSQFNDKPE